uniref:Putative secreted protein n=1 Tax=Anopheles darlingi TaxID=43151 RepID=A0A2M4DKE6_ANODA
MGSPWKPYLAVTVVLGHRTPCRGYADDRVEECRHRLLSALSVNPMMQRVAVNYGGDGDDGNRSGSHCTNRSVLIALTNRSTRLGRRAHILGRCMMWMEALLAVFVSSIR